MLALVLVLGILLGGVSPSKQVAASTAPVRPILWKTPASSPPLKALGDPASLLKSGTSRHVVIQFAEPIDDETRAELEAGGIVLLNYLGSNGYFAKLTGAGDQTTVPLKAGMVAAHEIDVNWKLHPNIAKADYPEFSLLQAPHPETKEQVETLAVYLVFHPDVDVDTEGMAALERHNATVRSHMNSINAVVAWVPLAEVEALAAEDAVQWVEPPLPPMEMINDSNRAITQTDEAGAYPFSLDGSGVNVLVYDGGTALASHEDFGGRLTVRDSSGLHYHPTHVAGTIGGDGSLSGGLYRGMAPGVTMQSYGYEWDGSGVLLYTNPGDIEADYNQAINIYGAEISNNSIGSNTAWNGFPCSYEGDYGAVSMLIDAIVRGSLGAPMRVVWANGNERGGACGDLYHTTAPPACAKNHITVGALNSNDDSMTSFSSWGPTDDGRIKPDVSAPGCQSNDDGGVTSCWDDGGYGTICGTSMAAPTVCGIGALILQDWKARFPTAPLPRNSTLKALLAHNASDEGNIGPDYQFGYGSVRAKDTIHFLRNGSFLEDQLSQGQDKVYFIYVPSGGSPLKATLAWDDPPGAINTTPELVNDLDLLLIAPDSTAHFPWTLDPANPSFPAGRDEADHVNNIEQVVVDSAAAGIWTVQVSGFSVAQGPQVFSLTTTPDLIECSSEGTAILDASLYTCDDTATIVVNDCDLDANSEAVETALVSIASTSEPGGETVLLTETGPPTGAFVGTISLSTTNSAGVLQVSDGDTITLTYNDADDGSGSPAVVTATATADGTAPTVSDVTVADLYSILATVTFQSDEPASGAIRYGTTCGAFTGWVPAAGVRTNFSIPLIGLDPETDYYFVVDVTDPAGNVTSDGEPTCHTFTTPARPDYFTEVFDFLDNDLDNRCLSLVPDGSPSFYKATIAPVTEFPVSPTGGTVLDVGDDRYQQVNLTNGKTVSLYGTNYSTFYVGSNGYITFTAGDEAFTESPATHFDLPRISALFIDLTSTTSGEVSRRQLDDRAVVTWLGVPQYDATDSNSFQIEMFFDGRLRITWLGIDAESGLAGLSNGEGVPIDFLESDLTAYPLSPPDSDFDGISDADETAWGLDPNSADTDGDGLSDLQEVSYDGDSATYDPYHPVTNPGGTDLDGANPDSDGDGTPDGAELNGGTDPMDEEDYTIWYVDASASGAGNGSSWGDAFLTVGDAITEASAAGGGQIWVAEGLYPEAVTLSDWIALYGGFAGAELPQTRDPATYSTILDGSTARDGERAYHVVLMGQTVHARLDGFVVTGGNADGAFPHNLGGGVFCNNVDSTNVVTNCTIVGNESIAFAGGLFVNYFATPVISNCVISGNKANWGGGVLCQGDSNPTISNCIITGNEGGMGGGIGFGNASTGTVTNCTISENTAGQGGGLCSGSQLFGGDCQPVVTNTLFSGNTGHAIVEHTEDSDAVVSNCLFYDNPDGDYLDENVTSYAGDDPPGSGQSDVNNIVDGQATANLYGDPAFVEGIEGAWVADATYNDTTFRTTLTAAADTFTPNTLVGAIINADTAQLKQALVIANTASTVTVVGEVTALSGASFRVVDYHLDGASAAIDLGTYVGAPSDDIDGDPRPVDLPAIGRDGTGTEFDIGADEALEGAAIIRVTSPNGGESISAGTIHEITWTWSGAVGPVRIRLLKGGVVLPDFIVKDTPNDGSFLWNVPSDLEAGTDYCIRIFHFTGSDFISDDGDGDFTIEEGLGITVTSPNGGESVQAGSLHEVTWDWTGSLGPVRIRLMKGGVVQSGYIAKDTPNDGSFLWSVPNELEAGGDYRVRIFYYTGTDFISDDSDGDFTVEEGLSITVTSPNGGESIQGGTSHEITWTSNGPVGDVRIRLLKGGVVQSGYIAKDTLNDGSFVWNVPSDLEAGSDYRIRIFYYTGSEFISDESNGNFTVTAGPTITVTSPNGGESLQAGTTHEITWTSTGSVGPVRIRLLKGGVVLTGFIVKDTPNDGSFVWSIPGGLEPGSDYRVRIFYYTGTEFIMDESNGDFTVTAP